MCRVNHSKVPCSVKILGGAHSICHCEIKEIQRLQATGPLGLRHRKAVGAHWAPGLGQTPGGKEGAQGIISALAQRAKGLGVFASFL